MAHSSNTGLEGIAAGETAISDLSTGLSYRGYAVESLGALATFEETAYLLLYGELPNSSELLNFRRRLKENAFVPDELLSTLRILPRTATPIDVLRTSASLLALFDADVADNSPAATLRKSERLLAQLPVALAAWHRIRQGCAPLLSPGNDSLAANFLFMLHDKEPSPEFARALDVTFIMYAEHEFNASTFAARVVASTLSDLHSAVTAAIGALKGPLHGGANERVMNVLAAARSPEFAESWIRQQLDEKRRIMGFGHRVYKQGDPRAVFLKSLCQQLAKSAPQERLEETAEAIETILWNEKHLPPNLDWPSARIYHYLGLPIDLYTPLFVLSRVSGWCAHIREQLENNRLIRPSAVYVGLRSRPFVPCHERQ